jgi:TrpR-related protein YerC/YecD
MRLKQEELKHDHVALYEAILSLKNVNEVANFFADLCTPVELQDMIERWRVITPLMAEIPYRQIHELTGVSVTTIGRVARSLKYGAGGYELVYKRMMGKSNVRKNSLKDRGTKKRSPS